MFGKKGERPLFIKCFGQKFKCQNPNKWSQKLEPEICMEAKYTEAKVRVENLANILYVLNKF